MRTDLPQVDELIKAAKTTVFFIDDYQTVRPNEAGSTQLILEAADRNGADVSAFELDTQFRMSGSKAFLTWVDHTLGLTEAATPTWDADNETFDFRIVDSVEQLDALIRSKADEGHSARLTAGFCWPGATRSRWHARPRHHRRRLPYALERHARCRPPRPRHPALELLGIRPEWPRPMSAASTPPRASSSTTSASSGAATFAGIPPPPPGSATPAPATTPSSTLRRPLHRPRQTHLPRPPHPRPQGLLRVLRGRYDSGGRGRAGKSCSNRPIRGSRVISDHFDRLDHDELPLHSWTRWTKKADDPGTTPEAIASLLAEFIMANRCVGAPQYARAWQRVVAGGEPYSDQERQGVVAFVGPLLGEPTRPLPADQVQGAIAEHLWYLLVTSEPTDGEFFRVHGPKFHATAPGGDGLVIYDGDAPAFRLWEIKKHASASSVSRTVRDAYIQLQASAEKYLAHYSAAGQESDDPRWARVYAELIDHWVSGNSPCRCRGCCCDIHSPRAVLLEHFRPTFQGFQTNIAAMLW